MTEETRSAPERLADPAILDDAVKRGAYLAILKHARAGQMVATWKDGKVVWVPASEVLARLDEQRNGTH